MRVEGYGNVFNQSWNGKSTAAIYLNIPMEFLYINCSLLQHSTQHIFLLDSFAFDFHYSLLNFAFSFVYFYGAAFYLFYLLYMDTIQIFIIAPLLSFHQWSLLLSHLALTKLKFHISTFFLDIFIYVSFLFSWQHIFSMKLGLTFWNYL